MLRLPRADPLTPAQHDALACRNEHMKKRAINALKINHYPLSWVADLSVLCAITNIMELKLKVGIDRIKFGLKPDDIDKLLGKPDKIKTDEDNPEKVIWVYNHLKLRLAFYKDESDRLGYIHSASNDLSYKENIIINTTIEFALEEIFKNIKTNWQVEVYEFFTTYFNDESWLTLTETFGVITEVEMGVPFLNDKEYEWP